MSVCVCCSTGLESYSALLTSLQEVLHQRGFDLATPVVRRDGGLVLQPCVCSSAGLGLLLENNLTPPPGLSHPTHHSPMCLPFSHLLSWASPVCPSCVCLTFDTHLLNICHFSTDCQNVLVPSGSRGPRGILSAKKYMKHTFKPINIYMQV